jgi:hypothetical protein
VLAVADDNDALQEALAAYLEHLEMGGPEPDTSHLSADEKSELQELVEALELTEGVAFDKGEPEAPVRDSASTPGGDQLLAELRGSLPPGVRIEADENRLVERFAGVGILDRWIVGTFGGRVRVWLLDSDAASAIEESAETWADLSRVFRMFPDMSAIALTGKDMSCLIVEPQDASPQIQVPSGSMIGRRYKRAIEPVTQALPTFLDELIPFWDPMPAFDPGSRPRVDVSEIAQDLARGAIEHQRHVGDRARKGNPKKDALVAFGDKEISALNSLTNDLYNGTLEPDEVEAWIERSAEAR